MTRTASEYSQFKWTFFKKFQVYSIISLHCTQKHEHIQNVFSKKKQLFKEYAKKNEIYSFKRVKHTWLSLSAVGYAVVKDIYAMIHSRTTTHSCSNSVLWFFYIPFMNVQADPLNGEWVGCHWHINIMNQIQYLLVIFGLEPIK